MIKVLYLSHNIHYYTDELLPAATVFLLKTVGAYPLERREFNIHHDWATDLTDENIAQAQAVIDYMKNKGFEYTRRVQQQLLGRIRFGTRVSLNTFTDFWKFALMSRLIKLCEENKIEVTQDIFDRLLLLAAEKPDTTILLDAMLKHQVAFTAERLKSLMSLTQGVLHTFTLNNILKPLSKHDETHGTALVATLFDKILADTSQGLHGYLWNPFILMFGCSFGRQRHAHLLTPENVLAVLAYKGFVRGYFEGVVLNQAQFDLVIRYRLMNVVTTSGSFFDPKPLSASDDLALREAAGRAELEEREAADRVKSEGNMYRLYQPVSTQEGSDASFKCVSS